MDGRSQKSDTRSPCPGSEQGHPQISQIPQILVRNHLRNLCNLWIPVSPVFCVLCSEFGRSFSW